MPRETFDRRLHEVQQQLLVLGSMAIKAVEHAIAALRERDLSQAQEVIDGDQELDDLAYQIEERSLLLIATQQPLAGDLRIISSVMAISGELERIGDYAEGIAKVAILSLDEAPLAMPGDILRMAELAADMLHRGLDAFQRRDVTAANAIWHEDDHIDDLQDRVYETTLAAMIADPHTVARATHLMWVSHNLERIADRVTNICERTTFMVTGVRAERVSLG